MLQRVCGYPPNSPPRMIGDLWVVHPRRSGISPCLALTPTKPPGILCAQHSSQSNRACNTTARPRAQRACHRDPRACSAIMRWVWGTGGSTSWGSLRKARESARGGRTYPRRAGVLNASQGGCTCEGEACMRGETEFARLSSSAVKMFGVLQLCEQVALANAVQWFNASDPNRVEFAKIKACVVFSVWW